MPVMARYDSWKPMEVSTEGVIASWIISAAQKVLTGRLLLCSILADSLSSMNRNARTSDGEAPVMKVYVPDNETIMMLRNVLAPGELPRMEVAYPRIR